MKLDFGIQEFFQAISKAEFFSITCLYWIPLYSEHPKLGPFDVFFKPFEPLYSEHLSIMNVFCSVPRRTTIKRVLEYV